MTELDVISADNDRLASELFDAEQDTQNIIDNYETWTDSRGHLRFYDDRAGTWAYA